MKASRITAALVAFMLFGAFVTVVGVVYYFAPNLLGLCTSSTPCTVTSQYHLTIPQSVLLFLGIHSIPLATGGWLGFAGLWIWRGRMRSRWNTLGFDRDVFDLFTKMRGAETRIKLLEALSVPSDRFQLAKQTGMEWKAVDRHIKVMLEHQLIQENTAYGNVKIYQLTPRGTSLLKLLKSFNEAGSSSTQGNY